MRIKNLISFWTIIAAVAIAWWIWSASGRTYQAPRPNACLDVEEVFSMDTDCPGRILAIQPYMLPEDYRSENHFYEKLNTYFIHARSSGFLDSLTIVLLPEYLGTWLVIADEKNCVAEAESLDKAMMIMVLSNLPSFLVHRLINNPENNAQSAIFRMKAAKMAAIYKAACRRLASEYKVTIVAGSIVLPDPVVRENDIFIATGSPLYNVGFVFNPDGSIHPQVVKKSFLTLEEQPFLSACPVDDLPVFDTPSGKMAVLICADSWFPESYESVMKKNAEIILVPSFTLGNNAMSQPWKGYSGQKIPADVNIADINSITEKEAWQKYALPARFPSNAILGVNVFLRGQLWNLGSDGQTLLVYGGRLLEARQSQRAGMWFFACQN